MDALHIPDNATETYLERLAENISRQLDKATNQKIRKHLEDMLLEVHKRLKELRLKTQQFPEEEMQDDLEVLELTDIVEEERKAPAEEEQEILEPEPIDEEAETSDVLLLTDLIEEEEESIASEKDLSDQERDVMKGRLRQALGKLQDKRQAAPQKSDSVLLADVMREISEEKLLDSADLTAEAQAKIKNRLKGILDAFQARKQQAAQEAEVSPFAETLERKYRVVPVEEEEAEKERPLGEFGKAEKLSGDLTVRRAFEPLSPDPEFARVCEKVSKGESLGLFDGVELTDREHDLINSFIGYLSTYKGVKRQQSFEMQHLTARSIHELDLIFKTYRIQGYLKAELTNVYNRLLNLRGRFSILLN